MIRLTAREGVVIRRGFLIGLGALLTVAGVIFTLQGLGALGGSAMSGVTLWAVVGPIVAVVGLAMAAAGLRRGSSRDSRP